nr:MAG TPA: hypothetical protein [Caudoviricetes sp.]
MGRLITFCPLLFLTWGVLIAIAAHYKYFSITELGD